MQTSLAWVSILYFESHQADRVRKAISTSGCPIEWTNLEVHLLSFLCLLLYYSTAYLRSLVLLGFAMYPASTPY